MKRCGMWSGLRRATRVTGAIAAATLAGAAVPSAAAAQEAEPFEWSGRLTPGQTLEIKGVNGAIRATAARGERAQVRAIRTGRRSDPASVRVEVVEHPGGVTVCAVYPDARKDRPNECVPGPNGHLSSRDNDVEVAFTAHVPDGVRLVARTVNGRVEAAELEGDVKASTVNGDVRISTASRAEASTVNGSVTVAMGRADWEGSLEVSTVNGEITMELPADTDAEVRARTVNGSLETDFPLTISGRFSARDMRGTIGSGGRRLELSTVNGSIRLRRGG